MSSNLSEDAKRLRDAVAASEAEAGATSVSIEHYNRQPSKVKPLFAVAEAIWNGSTEPIVGITHPDILRFLLQIDSVCCEAALCNIAYINAGKINGKMALYCVSELRVAISRLSSQASQDRDLVEETIHSILEIGRALTAPILEGGYDLHSYTTCLELLPVAVEALVTLQRFEVHSGGDNSAHEMLLNDVFGVKWEGALVLPLSSILCELYPHLSRDNLRSFEEKLTATSTNGHNSAQSAQGEDFAGVIRVALRLFEQSNDTRWVHVLRKLYKSVPTNTHTYDSVQTLLEQILSESLHVAKLLLSVLEDMCVVYGSVAVRESCFRQTKSVHSVEVVCVSDVRLALVVVRSICSSSGGSSMNAIEDMPLPLLLQSTQDVHHAQAVYDSQLCSRCVCMLLLTCVALQVAEQVRYEQYNAQSVHNALCSVVSSVLYMTRLGGKGNKSTGGSSSASSAGSSGFLTAARIQEVVRAVLVLAAYPDITQSCVDTVSGWFADAANTSTSSGDVVIKVEGESRVELPLVELPSTAHVLQTILCHVYATVNAQVRPALTTCVMKGIVQCATYTPGSSTTTSTNTGEYGVSTQSSTQIVRSAKNKNTQHSNTGVAVEVQPLHNMLQSVLYTLCTTHTECFTETYDQIAPHYAALLLCTIPTSVSRVQHSLIHCCYTSSPKSIQLFGTLQSSLQKHVQSVDPRRQLDSLRSLVFLLFSVPDTAQAQVLKTIEYGFNRNAVYSREICVLLVRYLKQMDSAQIDEDSSTGTSATPGNTAIHRLTDTTLRALRDVVANKLNTYCIDSGDTVVFDVIRCIGGIRKPKSVSNTNTNTDANTAATSGASGTATTPTTTNTTNTTTNTTHANITITEDIGHLLQLCYTIDILIDSECTVQDIQALCSDSTARHAVTSPSVVFMQAVLQAVKTGLRTTNTTNTNTNTNTSSSTSSQITTHSSNIDGDSVVDAEVQVCMMLCAYSAVGGVICCMLESCVSTSSDSNVAVHSSSTSRGSSSKSSKSGSGITGTYNTITDLMAVQDTLLHLATDYKSSDISSFKSLESCYNAKLTGSEVCSIVYGSGSSSAQAVLYVSPLALQRWLQFVLSTYKSSASVFPMSALCGVCTYTAYLVRVTCAQSTPTTTATATAIHTTTTAADTSHSTTSTDTTITALFAQLLTLYEHTVRMQDESTSTAQQQQYIKRYCKYLRKIHNPAKPRRSKSSHKKRRKARSGDSVSSGEILSESESESDDEDEVEVVKEVEVEVESVRFSPTGRNTTSSGGSSGGGSGGCSVDFVIDHATTDSDSSAGAALPLLCALLCNLHTTVQGVYDRWDTHIVQNAVHKPQYVHSSPYGKYATPSAHYPSHYTTSHTHNSARNSTSNTNTSTMSSAEAGRVLSLLRRRDVYGEVRSVLFSLRSELMLALSSVLSVSGAVIDRDGNGSSVDKSAGVDKSSNNTDAPPLTAHYCAELCTFIANEVQQSMQAGITPRVFNAYTQLLQSLLTTITATTTTATNTITAMDASTSVTLRGVSGVLWGALREWQYPDTRIVGTTVQLALRFSHLSGSTADLTQCMEVLQSIGHQHHGGSSDDNGKGGNGSSGKGSGSGGGKGRTGAGSDNEGSVGSGVDDEPMHTCPTNEHKDTTTSTTGKEKYSIVVHSKIVDQVVKEVLHHLHGTFSDTIKVQQSLSTVPTFTDDANSGSRDASKGSSSNSNDENADTEKHALQVDPLLLTTATLSNTTGNVLNALYSLFDAPSTATPTTNPTNSAKNSSNSDDDQSGSDIDITTTSNKRTKSKKSSTSSNKKARTSTSSAKKTAKTKNTKTTTTTSATSRAWLIDALKGRQGLDVVALINKLNAQCIKECSALLHAARHLRKVCAYVVQTSKVLRREREELRNGFSSDEEEEKDSEEERHRGSSSWNHHGAPHKRHRHHHQHEQDSDSGSESDASGSSASSSSTSSPDPIQLQLHRLGSATTLVHCTTLFALLGSVAPQSVSDYLAWLEEQPPSRHTQRAVTVLEDLKLKLFYVLQELHNIPPEEEMMGVKDPRLLSLLHYVHHEHLRRVLELVNREGSALLLCLQGPAEESDGEMSDTERDLRDFGRKTVTKGRASLLLRGAPRSAKTSAMAAFNAERMSQKDRARKSNANKTIRVSRNSGLNEMFQKDAHTGEDTYADLEDFIAPDEEDV